MKIEQNADNGAYYTIYDAFCIQSYRIYLVLLRFLVLLR